MSANIEKQGSVLDKLIWWVVAAVLIGTVAGNHFLEKADSSILIRVAVVVVALGIAVALALLTEKGKAILAFSKDARVEVRKVVWPTRQETIQTTLIVMAVTLVMGLLFFPLDAALVWVVNLVTGV